MIASMTAFSRQQSNHSWGTLVLEIRSVNHRYLDLTFKLPETLRVLEMPWRTQIKKHLNRGKVECQLRIHHDAQSQQQLIINQSLLQQITDLATEIQISQDNSVPLDPLALLRWPGVVGSNETDNNEVIHAASELLQGCLDRLIETRFREGEELRHIIDERLTSITAILAQTREKLPEILSQQKSRLLARLAELDADLDQQRLEQEIVYISQKADVDEELDRLVTHLQEVQRTLDTVGPCGRRLDFLMQELNREANTLSSKSISSQTSQNAVELKVLIEQMREQIQNIE